MGQFELDFSPGQASFSGLFALQQRTLREPAIIGLVASLARPEGNVTGVAWFGLLSKQIELLTEIVPHLRRVAYIADPSDRPPPVALSKVGKEHVTSAASTPGFTWQYFPPALGNDYDENFFPSRGGSF